MMEERCVFCEIVAGREPAEVLYEDDDLVVFRNLLSWVPVTLLVVPRRHIDQAELWRDLGRLAPSPSIWAASTARRAFACYRTSAARRCRARRTRTSTSSAGTQLGRYV